LFVASHLTQVVALLLHAQALQDISSLVANVKEGQVALADGVSASIEGVRDVAARARGLQQQMAASLEVQVGQ
jgi:hypothetical protein